MMKGNKMRDRLGLVFFTFATIFSALLAWEQPSVLAWLVALHNAILAVIYTRRRPARSYDRFGLGLGILAAFLPMAAPYPERIPWTISILGILGYGLVLWSLLTLGNRFSIAPADRGLVVTGPYHLVRHPMYLGELVIRGALVATAPEPMRAWLLLLTLAGIQVLRILREERILTSYDNYAARVRFRLLPGIW
jgi:protein-S-isoprenylcysteine O-methyltransferase Ste14